jgi:hypothetical protein
MPDHNGKEGVEHGDVWAEKWLEDARNDTASGETVEFLTSALGYTQEDLNQPPGSNCGENAEWDPAGGVGFGACECIEGYIKVVDVETDQFVCNLNCNSDQSDDGDGNCVCNEPNDKIATNSYQSSEIGGSWNEGDCIANCQDGDEYNPDERTWDETAGECECLEGEFKTDSIQFPGEGKCLTAENGVIVWSRQWSGAGMWDSWTATRDVNEEVPANGYYAPVLSTKWFHCDQSVWYSLGQIIEVKIQNNHPDGSDEEHDEYSVNTGADSFGGTLQWETSAKQIPSTDTKFLKDGASSTNLGDGLSSSSYMTTFDPSVGGGNSWKYFMCNTCGSSQWSAEAAAAANCDP